MYSKCHEALKIVILLIGVVKSRAVRYPNGMKQRYQRDKRDRKLPSVATFYMRGGSSSNTEFSSYDDHASKVSDRQYSSESQSYSSGNSEIEARVQESNSPYDKPHGYVRDRDDPYSHTERPYNDNNPYGVPLEKGDSWEPELPPDSAYMGHPFSGGEEKEPPLPTSPYESGHSVSEGQRHPLQQQQRIRTHHHSPRPQRPQYHEPRAESLESSSELELESFDKDLIFSGLKRMYRKKIMPLEISSKYGHFHSSPLSPSDFEAKPMVLLLGQYSVGKTSFIKYLLGRDFPGIRIGPEPTTDRFNCIMQGDADKIIPGAALCSQADRPFRGLSPFGNTFLSRLEGVELDAPILQNITLVDTPGILSGAKQSMGRNYDYDAVMKWFAERADLIIIMFDAHKLDISDELKRVIELMKPHADKVRVVLNKADSISTQQLMRVYGALMWQLGKVMNTPETCRVYIGSFWGGPLKNIEQATLLNREKLDLFTDIAQLPQNAVMRRINELVKRARSVKVHAYIIHYLRKQLPYTWGKKEKQARLIDRLDRELVMCARRYELPRGDFPEVGPLRQALLEIKDLSEFPKLDKRMVKDMDKVFSVDIPELLERARDT